MKSVIPFLLVAGIIGFSFHGASLTTGTVHGSITPIDAGNTAFLFSSKDTLTSTINNGNFNFSNVPVGSYKILVEAVPPYKNATKEGISVTDGDITDAGQVQLLK